MQVADFTPPFRWNAQSARYIDARGRYVSAKNVRVSVDGFIEGVRSDARMLSQRLARQEMTLAHWQRGMMKLMKSAHIATYATAKGGIAQLTQADFGRIGQTLRSEYRFLNTLAQQVEQGRVSAAQLSQRADSYIEAARTSYESARRINCQERGFTHEFNVLSPANHCSECLSLSARGPVPIGTLPLPGNRKCRRNCKCRIEYRRRVSIRIRAA